MKAVMLSFMAIILALGLVLPACSPLPASTPAATAPPEKPVPAPGAAWEQTWANTLAAARKEAVVSIYCTGWGPQTQRALTEAFKNKFGVDLEFILFGRGVELVARVQTEKSARLNIVDVIGTGSGTLLPVMKPQGLLGDIGALLILPEATDPGAWGGRLPFIDKDRTAIGMVANTQRYMIYNTDLVKKGEVTSYKDALKPQYKGKIVLNDPTISGGGNVLFSFLSLDAWNPEEAQDFLRQLIKQQEAVITRDAWLMVETVARGKYAIALGPDAAVVREFLKAGAPIEVAFLKEGTGVAATNGTMGVPANIANPNAARVFVNWLLTREGQTVFSRAQGLPSGRTDVPAEGIVPQFLPQPGEKLYFDENEEMVLIRGAKMTGMLTEVIRQAGR
ncbi:MAG: extracellular solute-binding protein [Chloroflexi bacterium]|nr:extracellular solute-binding protein [Chloroflexota bacterium]